FHVPGATSDRIDRRVKKVSFLQNLPGSQRFYRYLLPFYPLAISRFDFSGYDLVVSLSHAAAKNIRVPKGVPHICYCFTPMRYIWDQAQSYFGRFTKLLWPLLKVLRRWDVSGSRGVSEFVAISRFVASRIRHFYGRSSTVIFPPVKTSWITPACPGEKGEAFLYAGALVPYKRPELVVAACNQLGLPLWIAGSGPMEDQLKEMAGETVHFFGRLNDEEFAQLFRRCRALLFPGKEDFGMIPIECLAAGRPVIGLYAGALRESLSGVMHWIDKENKHIRDHACTGVFVQPKTEGDELDALLASIRFFLDHEDEFTVEHCTARAQLFSPERFAQDWNVLLERVFPNGFAQSVNEERRRSDAQAEAAAL
ncbi:MAG: glycosyltransferase, partial [Bdellovibrionales bacterium]|nr:glycosyltransferase [Bdellovibrionales bacterium]